VTSARAAFGALAAAGALTLGACGGSDSTTSTTTTTTTVAAGGSGRTLVAQSHSGAFDAEAIYEHAAPGVVTISSILPGSTPSLLGGGPSAAEGAGFVISSNGEIATNAHVVTDAESGGGGGGPIHEAKEVFVQFADRNQVSADIVGFDPQADVALLKVDPSGLSLHPLQFGSSENVRTGESVAAIGSPFFQDRSLSVGVVSATDRSIPSLTNFQIEGAIQTDAAINPGNSGGPLLDAEGKVIGIDQQINTTSGGNEGVAFAVPVDLVKHSLDELRANGTVKYAYIGLSTEPLYPQLADKLGIPTDTGALVAKVTPNSPAAHAGLQGSDQKIQFQGQEVAVGGDAIVAVDGHKLVGKTDLPALIAEHDPGDTVTLEIIRDGKTQNIDVTLAERPENVPG
jgi:S1-C subfamily serine protease